MKPILLTFLSFLTLFHATFSQSDIAVIDVAASSDVNNWVPQGLNTTLEVTFQNMDSLPIPMGDSILVSIQTGFFVADAWVVLPVSLDTMETYSHNFGTDNRISFTSSMDTTVLIGMATHLADTNLANNQWEETFYASTIVNNDWYAGPIAINKPANLNFFDIDNGTNIPPQLSEIEVSMINNGTVTYLEGTLLEYEVYVDNDVRPLFGNVTESIANGESSVRIVSNQAVMPAIPDSAGTYQLCARSLTPNDLTPENNAACMVFKIIDNFDPEDPDNWIFGAEDVEKNEVKMFVSDRSLVIETNENFSLEIIDLSGKVIRSESHQGNVKIAMNELSTGIYFARVIQDNSEPQTMKILLP
ncbi:T9SS type A sorting domain-containing protein [Salibacteraceae bacterium]|nr:T9SS type A sorting domain-containing protein [Salibacteraceae bacterium]